MAVNPHVSENWQRTLIQSDTKGPSKPLQDHLQSHKYQFPIIMLS